MTEPAAMPELFSCERLSARLTVRACGLRFMRVRAATKGSQDYDSACDQCPIGAHHAKHGTLCPDTTKMEVREMGTSGFSVDQQRSAARRVIVGQESRTAVAAELGVTGTTVSNWVKRWGTDVASDAMTERASTPRARDEPATAATNVDQPAAAPKRTRPPAPAPAQNETPATRHTDQVATVHDLLALLEPILGQAPRPVPTSEARQQLGRLGAELGAGVCFVADRRARAAVADAAWLLSEASRG